MPYFPKMAEIKDELGDDKLETWADKYFKKYFNPIFVRKTNLEANIYYKVETWAVITLFVIYINVNMQ